MDNGYNSKYNLHVHWEKKKEVFCAGEEAKQHWKRLDVLNPALVQKKEVWPMPPISVMGVQLRLFSSYKVSLHMPLPLTFF